MVFVVVDNNGNNNNNIFCIAKKMAILYEHFSKQRYKVPSKRKILTFVVKILL